MFHAGDESSEASHEHCEDDCSSSDGELYLDQIAAKKYEEGTKKKQADRQERFLEYALEGIDVPIRMRKDSEATSADCEEQAEMEGEIPFPPVVVETVVTDPIVVTSLSSVTRISASAEAIEILNHHRKQKKTNRKTKKAVSEGRYSSGATTPHMRPPPSTPLEHATFPHTLSTPHLPVFHHYTDDLLLQQYQVERAKGPADFDLQTAKIKQYLLDAKIERGGRSHLEENEYSVDLASREDARKVQRMAIQRSRGATETESAPNLDVESSPPTHPLGHAISGPAREAAVTTATRELANAPLELPDDFDFAKHVAKYTTSGSMRHQHSRTVVEDDTGSKTVLKTWIEITQEINVPTAEQLSWEDVKIARKNARQARKKAKTSAKGKKCEDASDANDDGEARDEPKIEEEDAKKLLGAIAKISSTDQLSRGISLSRYLKEIAKDVDSISKDKKIDGLEDESD